MEARANPGAVAWHHARRRSILADSPEVTALAGHNPWTATFIVALVLAQLGVGVLVRGSRWYVIALAAYLLGSVLAHALGVLIHECAHNLVMGSSSADKALGILANVPLVLPGAMDFRHKHLLHHRHLGEGELRDFQTPVARGAAWVGGSPVRKAVWLAVGALLFPRGHVEGTPVGRDRWDVANLLAEILVLLPYTVVFGPGALGYLVLSGLLAFGPHPLGVRGFGEHITGREGQPTSSYYGPLNLVSFNVGHHVEHHDFPRYPGIGSRASTSSPAPTTRRSPGSTLGSACSFATCSFVACGSNPTPTRTREAEHGRVDLHYLRGVLALSEARTRTQTSTSANGQGERRV